ncbi:hypothetical protein, partial [Bifidobacterium erythrocebi]|uniref:hypothetical protein n=1 Tax=Bifidobacterium erythrocebi TaxID=2675325 RepID=UPI00197B923C
MTQDAGGTVGAMAVKPLTCMRKGRPECETTCRPVAGVGQAGRKRQSMASDEAPAPAATADTGERRTGKTTHGNDFAK